MFCLGYCYQDASGSLPVTKPKTSPIFFFNFFFLTTTKIVKWLTAVLITMVINQREIVKKKYIKIERINKTISMGKKYYNKEEFNITPMFGHLRCPGNKELMSMLGGPQLTKGS